MNTEAVRKQLLELRNNYDKRIRAIDEDVHHKSEPVEKDFAEQATQRENDDVLMSLDDEARQTLIQIDRALFRLEEGNYGICAACGQAISAERLRVVPFAELCIECASTSA
jgi:RNA polymerase-binding protein DksA